MLLRSFERRAHEAEARLAELEQGQTPAPLYWQAERDHYEATIRQMGAGARAWQSAYAALHKQLRDNGLEPIRWMESSNV